LIREGLEDYEYFWTLQQTKTSCEQFGFGPSLVTQANGLLAVPTTILTSLSEYTDNPTLLQNHRTSIGLLLEEMLQFDLVDGLVGHWKMNENAASLDVLDTSANGNNGLARRYTSLLSTVGISDGALNFDGSSDYIDCGYNQSFDFDTDLTISAWIKLGKLGEIGPIVQKREAGAGDQSFYFRVYTNNKLASCFYDGSTWISILGQTELSHGSWHHVAATYDGQNMRLYVNGELDRSKSESRSIASSSHHIIIGKDHHNYYKGSMDDIRIYKTALSQSQIYEIYSDAKYFDPAAWWPMNDNAGNNTVQDLSGNGNHGAAQRNTNLISNSNGALTFNGVSDYINYGDNSYFDFSSGLHASAWIKLDSLNRIAPIIQKRHAGTGNASFYFRMYTNNRLAFSVYNGSQWVPAVLGSKGLNSDIWYHVACSCDGQYLRVYVDGKIDGHRQYSGTIASGAQSLRIGKDGIHYFAGSIGNVVIHNQPVSSSVIRSIYVRESLPGLIGWWPLDDNASSTLVDDVSGYNNDGAARRNTNLLQFADLNRDGLIFNGSSDYIDCGNNSIFDAAESLSVSAWVKLDSANKIQPIVQKREEGSGHPSFYFRIYVNNKMAFAFYNGSIWTGAVSGQTALSQGTWHHTVVTYDGQSMRLYLDGQLDASRNQSSSIATSTHSLIIGKDATHYFHGCMDEVLLFDRALTAGEVLSVGHHTCELILAEDNGDSIPVSVSLHVYNRVDFEEFALLGQYWRMSGCDEGQPCNDVDWYNDGVIDMKDLNQLALSWLGDAAITDGD